MNRQESLVDVDGRTWAALEPFARRGEQRPEGTERCVLFVCLRDAVAEKLGAKVRRTAPPCGPGLYLVPTREELPGVCYMLDALRGPLGLPMGLGRAVLKAAEFSK